MSRTVRKNSKEFAAAVSGAKNIKVFSLGNGFTGQPVDEFPQWVGNDFQLVADAGGYKARVHSNLWFEFEVAA